MTSERIWSVGHGARTAGAFVSLLRGAGIRRLVDVRTRPGSRRHPQFGQSALASSLAEEGIAYRWEQDLGGFRTPRPDSANTALRVEAFRGYADHMETETFARALARLCEDAGRDPTAFMCAETLWTDCHRRLIADALTIEGWEVVHLVEPGRREPHELHAALRVRVLDGRLRYDAGGAEQGRLDLG